MCDVTSGGCSTALFGQVSVSAGHYMEALQVCDGVVEIVGNGNMQVQLNYKTTSLVD